MKRMLLMALVLLLMAAGLAETVALPDLSGDALEAGAEATEPARTPQATVAAPSSGRELSGYFGQPIAGAAEQIGGLSFEAPDTGRFPCLELAYEALRRGGNAPCALNAANEVAVAAYLKGLISFYDIAKIGEKALTGLNFVADPSLDDIFATNSEVAAIADGYIH